MGSGVGGQAQDMAAVMREAVSAFGAAVAPRLRPTAPGEPEDNLRAPFEELMRSAARPLGVSIVMHGETLLREYSTKPDYAVEVNGLLCGHVELKAPGTGVQPSQFVGHNRDQWNKLKRLHNLLYFDGNSFALYRQGERYGAVARLQGDVRTAGDQLTTRGDGVARVLTDFIMFSPQAPRNPLDLARVVAELCHLMRDEVKETLELEESDRTGPTPFLELRADWGALLFPDVSNDEFADYYAQTVTFALLLAGAEGENLLAGTASVARSLSRRHGLLGRALDVLTEDVARAAVVTSLETLTRLISVVDWTALGGRQQGLPGFGSLTGSPWLYFYETFLSQYDPGLRNRAGAYYTPPAVVGAQVRLIEDVLRTHLGKDLYGFADPGVITLDPAMGTGSYLIQVVEQAAARVAEREGEQQVPARLRSFATQLLGFELMAGPFAVAQMLVTEELVQRTGQLWEERMRLYLADTLADPWAEETRLGGVYEPIAQSRREANRVKREEPVLVCLGNPPYDLHESDDDKGGWVVRGGEGRPPIWSDIVEGARAAGAAGDLKPIYNLYAYFWRWGLWKVFEAHEDARTGVVGFITASSFLLGPGWAGLRRTMRQLADEIWIIDLGGEGHGARQDENVFDIRTPVAITIIARTSNRRRAASARANVHYWRILAETRSEKYRVLNTLRAVEDIPWQDGPDEDFAPFVPIAGELWPSLPLLTDLLPWKSSGVGQNRNWPRAPSVEALEERWGALGRARVAGGALVAERLEDAPEDSREALFKETRDRYMAKVVNPLPGISASETPTIGSEPLGRMVTPVRHGWRSFDRQWLIPDSRILDMPRPPLWSSRSDGQVFLTTQHQAAMGRGPAVTFTELVPDLNYFNNRGGTTLPLWRDGEKTQPNCAPGLLDALSDELCRPVTAEDFLAYVAAIASHGGYSSTFWRSLPFRDLAYRSPRTQSCSSAQFS